jgi:hypothetical protein
VTITLPLSRSASGSVWIRTRPTADGGVRYRVEYRVGGREAPIRYGGSFRTMREATLRKKWIAGELAAMRVPDMSLLREPPPAPTFAEAAERWQTSRVDVAEATAVQHQTALNRALPLLGGRPLDTIAAQHIADLVAALHAGGKARESIRKTVTAAAMVFDHAGVSPNPARDRVVVKLPRDESEEPNPPSAEHVETAFRLIPSQHQLALLFLDWSGARVSAIDRTTVGDYDEPRRRVRLRKQTTKTRRALWIELHPALADAIEATLPPRGDRDPEARLFADSGADAAPDGHRKGVPRRRDPALEPARSAPPPHLAPARAGQTVGTDRRMGRAAEPRGHGEHVHARPRRRARARLRGAARRVTCSHGAVLRAVLGSQKVPFSRALRVQYRPPGKPPLSGGFRFPG